PLQGAVLLKALRAACSELAGGTAAPGAGVSAETPASLDAPGADGPPAANAEAVGQAAASAAAIRTSSDLADGLVAIAESFLAAKIAGADDPEVYQVVVHADVGMLTGRSRLRPRPAFPRKRPRPRIRPGATSRTARRSACPPRRWSPAP